jgi:hypothetical protein
VGTRRRAAGGTDVTISGTSRLASSRSRCRATCGSIRFSRGADHRRGDGSPQVGHLRCASAAPIGSATLRVFTGGESRLLLPVRAPRPEDAALAPFAPPETAPPLATETLRPGSTTVTTRTDAIQGLLESTFRTDHGHRRLIGNGVDHESIMSNTFSIVEGEPLSATARSDRSIELGQGEMRVRIETTSTMTSDANAFLVTNVLDAYEGNVRVFGKTRTFTVPRDHG